MKKILLLLTGITFLIACDAPLRTSKNTVISAQAELKATQMVDSVINAVKYPNKWEDQNIVDDFGDVVKTVKSQTVLGEFSNSATRDSDLKVVITEFPDLYRIQLYEYGYGASESLAYDWAEIILTVKLEDGSKVSGTVSLVPDGQGVYIYKKNKLGKLITNTSGYIKFGIVKGGSSYRFKILGNG